MGLIKNMWSGASGASRASGASGASRASGASGQNQLIFLPRQVGRVGRVADFN